MILESWSLMINDVDKKFFEKEENKEYKQEYESFKELTMSLNPTIYNKEASKINKKFSEIFKNYEILLKKNIEYLLVMLLEYLPLKTGSNSNIGHIVPTFLHIYDIVLKKYQNKILNMFNEKSNAYARYDESNRFIGCQFGFRPYSLLSESGARILQKNYKELNFIKDPELKYLKRTPKNKLCLLSITEKIDDLFNEIFKKINEFIGKNTFLRLFLRRTLCGCEFGICFNLNCEIEDFEDPNCLFDKDPILLFAINVRSMFPILAGILIIALVYLAFIIKDIIECVSAFPGVITKDILIKGLFAFCEVVGKDLSNKVLDKAIVFLDDA